MKNTLRSGGKIYTRRSKKLKSGEIQCPRCGDWKKVSKFTDKHFNEEYLCTICKKEVLPQSPPSKNKSKITPKYKPRFPIGCPLKPFFGCKYARGCVGCYYNPDKKIALTAEEDTKKTAKDHWFYHSKTHSKKFLEELEKIRLGKELRSGGNRCRFKGEKIKDSEDGGWL